jgi:hypothetical protein
MADASGTTTIEIVDLGGTPSLAVHSRPQTYGEVIFEAELRDTPPYGVAIVRRLMAGPTHSACAVVWSAQFDILEQAALHHDWLVRNPARCTWLGRHASVFGPEEATSEIELGLEVDRLEVDEKRLKAARFAQEAAERAEQERRQRLLIESFLDDADGWFGLNLRRGNEQKPFWVIRFRERWERERFRDWFRCQSQRFATWAEFLENNSADDLERMLLREMLETERRVKKAGLGAGGRRPLRFWRGDE